MFPSFYVFLLFTEKKRVFPGKDFRKKGDSKIGCWLFLKSQCFLVFLLLFTPQIFLQCWYGGTHHDILAVFKCKRDKQEKKSFKGQKDAAKATFLFYYSTYTQISLFSQKLIYCLPFTSAKLVWSEESCITNSAYTAHSTSQPWPRIFSYRVCRKCDMYHPVYSPKTSWL